MALQEAQGLIVQFYIDGVRNTSESKKKGCDVFDDKEHIKIIFPGAKDILVEAVTQRWIDEFPKEYARFQENKEALISGTPIDRLTEIPPSEMHQLKALGFLTVQSLAAASDIQIQSLGMGGQKRKELAAAYIDSAAQIAMVSERDAEIEALREEMAELKAHYRAASAEKASKVDPEQLSDAELEAAVEGLTVEDGEDEEGA